jgi:head-tail adaptor
MPLCKKIRADHRKVCIGDMRWRIDIFTPVITPANRTLTVDYSVTKVPFMTVWASVKTIPNVAIFDGANTEQTISHEFYIRYHDGIDEEKYIRYPASTGDFYNVVYTENFENRNEFILLKCNLRGVENV